MVQIDIAAVTRQRYTMLPKVFAADPKLLHLQRLPTARRPLAVPSRPATLRRTSNTLHRQLAAPTPREVLGPFSGAPTLAAPLRATAVRRRIAPSTANPPKWLLPRSAPNRCIRKTCHSHNQGNECLCPLAGGTRSSSRARGAGGRARDDPPIAATVSLACTSAHRLRMTPSVLRKRANTTTQNWTCSRND